MKVLVIAPHPDDETLGCGGTLLNHRKNGDELYWFIMTTMVSGGSNVDIEVQQYEAQRDAVRSAYDFSGLFQFDFPTTLLDTIPRRTVIAKCRHVFSQIAPDIVYLPSVYDVHSDHQIAFECAWSALKKFRCPSVKKIYMYETLSETENVAPVGRGSFVPTSFCDISTTLEEKIRIAKLYASEVADHPFPRSEAGMRSLALHRGAAAGALAAEGFMILREYW